ncbi:hypothetical protein KLP28_16335 [Nocardioidaceae bacterium]|nr:hypothetical protein KLP28_16335 [Nocardioidaceae bacterium]
MRLTSVALMTLPAGRVHGLTLTCRRGTETLPISFDQRRHVGLVDRPGSWMAVSARLPRDTPGGTPGETPGRLAAAWLAVVARHPTFRSAFARTDDRLLLHRLEVLDAHWVDHGAGEDEEQTRHLVRQVLDATCRPYAEPSHRLLLIDPHDAAESPVVVVGSDHAHVDMWSMLVVLRDLVTAWADGPDRLGPRAADFADHTSALAALPPAPASVRHRWWRALAAGGDAMPCFPLPLGEVTAPVPERLVVRDVLDADEAADLEAYARAPTAPARPPWPSR